MVEVADEAEAAAADERMQDAAAHAAALAAQLEAARSELSAVRGELSTVTADRDALHGVCSFSLLFS